MIVTQAVPGATSLPILPITIAAADAVAHRGWTAAREAALAALSSGPCVVVIAGAPGTGKTLLVQELARALAAAGVATVLHQRGDLGEDAETTADAQPAFRVILVDEADRMNEAALGRLAADPRSGLVLACKHVPAGDEADAFSVAASGGRPVTVVRLGPLVPGETAAFLHARLTAAGQSGDVLRDAAIAEIDLYSARVPRLVNMLASAALFLAATDGAAHVDAEHVVEAAALRGFSTPPERAATFGAPPPHEGEPSPLEAGASAEPPPSYGVPLKPLEADEIPIARSSVAASRGAPRSPSTRRVIARRRAVIFALCTMAGSTAAGGLLALRDTGPILVHRSSQSDRTGTISAGQQPREARAVAPSVFAQKEPSFGRPALAVPPLPPAIARARTHAHDGGTPLEGFAHPAIRSSSAAAYRPVRRPTTSPPERPAGASHQLPPSFPRSDAMSDQRAPTREPEPISRALASPPPDADTPLANPQVQPARHLYIGSYVMGPDGRREFIANP